VILFNHNTLSCNYPEEQLARESRIGDVNIINIFNEVVVDLNQNSTVMCNICGTAEI